MSAARSVHSQAVAALLLATALWGVSFPLIKSIALVHQQLLPDSGNWFIAAMTVAPRFLVSALVLGWLVRRELRSLTRLEIGQGLALGGAVTLGMLFQNDGLQFTPASTSAFLTQLYAILIPVWVAVRARRAPGLMVWVCCGLVLAGVAVLGRFDFATLRLGRGEAETLVSSLFYMVQILVLSDRRFAANRPLPVTVVMFGALAVLCTAFAFTAAPRAADFFVPWTSGSWLVFNGLLTVLCTLGAFTLMNSWQPKITATEAGLIYCSEPVFTALMALFVPGWFSSWAGLDYPNEHVTWHLLVGGGLITVANVLIQLRPPPAERPGSAEATGGGR